MSEEIKEILDRLDFNEWEVDLYKVPITWTELYDVRDYITNLQQKVEQLENIKKEAIEYIKENSKSYSLPNTIKDMRYIDFYKLLDILNKGSEE